MMIEAAIDLRRSEISRLNSLSNMHFTIYKNSRRKLVQVGIHPTAMRAKLTHSHAYVLDSALHAHLSTMSRFPSYAVR